MADEFEQRLEAAGQRQTPAADESFTARLESQLRAEHAALTPGPRRRAWVMLPRLAAAALVVVAGIVGLVTLRGDDAGVPVAVVDEEPAAVLDAAGEGGGDADDGETADGNTEQGEPATDVTVTATPTAPVQEPTQMPSPAPSSTPVEDPKPGATTTPLTPEPAVTPTEPTPVPPVEPTPTVVPQEALPTPTGTAVVSPTATPVVVVTPVPPATATAVPRPAPTATPSPLPDPTVEPAPDPTAEREPAPIELRCTVRAAGDAVGVVCEWDAPVSDRTIAGYQVTRSRNGSEAAIVSRQRASELAYTDRNVARDDEIIYLVQGVDSEGRVVAASVREVVTVAGQ